MTGFLGGEGGRRDYSRLQLKRNPFPTRGEVRSDVYVPRSEAKSLLGDLRAFVVDGGAGAFWAVEGSRGVGKSNLLRYVESELRAHQGSAGEAVFPCRYVSTLIEGTRQVVEELLLAVGEERLESWVTTEHMLPAHLRETDFGRLVANLPVQASEAVGTVEFLRRWLAGHQTYADERRSRGLVARERLEPGAAIPYLHEIVTELVGARMIGGIVLLLDEFEDVLSMEQGRETRYVMALKALVNTFNFRHLFVALAGQQGAFAIMGTRHTSLGSRWRTVTLEPLGEVAQAVELAKAYLAADRAELDTKGGLRTVDIEAVFGRLAGGRGAVAQRDLLDGLNRLVEERCIVTSRKAAVPAPKR